MGITENQHDADADGAEVPSVRERLRNGHISDARIELHHEARAISLDGEVVVDLDQPAPPGARITFLGR